MSFDITPYVDMSPAKVRSLIRQGVIDFPTARMPNVHGAPVHMGDPEKVGVKDIMKPDYGEAVDIYPGEIPVFWPCGVTPQAAVENVIWKQKKVSMFADSPPAGSSGKEGICCIAYRFSYLYQYFYLNLIFGYTRSI